MVYHKLKYSFLIAVVSVATACKVSESNRINMEVPKHFIRKG